MCCVAARHLMEAWMEPRTQMMAEMNTQNGKGAETVLRMTMAVACLRLQLHGPWGAASARGRQGGRQARTARPARVWCKEVGPLPQRWRQLLLLVLLQAAVMCAGGKLYPGMLGVQGRGRGMMGPWRLTKFY